MKPETKTITLIEEDYDFLMNLLTDEQLLEWTEYLTTKAEKSEESINISDPEDTI